MKEVHHREGLVERSALLVAVGQHDDIRERLAQVVAGDRVEDDPAGLQRREERRNDEGEREHARSLHGTSFTRGDPWSALSGKALPW
jgi:hypothetical protein